MVKKNLVWIFLGLSCLWSCSAFGVTPTATPVSTPTATPTGRVASSAFTAVDQQGRPMIGASIGVNDTFGNPIPACADANCLSVATQVNSTGVFQFWAPPGVYNVVLSNSGVQRNFVAFLVSGSGGGGGGGVTTLNTLAGALTLQVGTSGNGLTITTPDASHINFNLPYATSTVGGMVSNAAQAFSGPKSFTDQGIFRKGLTVNSTLDNGGNFLVSTSGNGCEFFTDALNNQVDIGTCDGTAFNALVVAMAPSTGAAIFGTAPGGGTGIQGLSSTGGGVGVEGTADAGSTGSGVAGVSGSVGAYAGRFERGLLGGGNVPVVSIEGADNADTQALLGLKDGTATVARIYVEDYKLNGSRKFGLTPAGFFQGTGNALHATFGFLGDVDTGLVQIAPGNVALTAAGVGVVSVVAGGTQLSGQTVVLQPSSANDALVVVNAGTGLSFNTDSGNFKITKTGEVTFAGVGADGTGKTLCVKADANIGTCTTVVGAGGTCTCA